MEFDHIHSYGLFAHYIRRSARHILDAQQTRFLETVMSTSNEREMHFTKGTLLWRAQMDHRVEQRNIVDDYGEVIDKFDFEAPCLPERMKPLPDRAKEGRVNPKGIPCLYLSDDPRTAMSEMRPWIGSLISLAQFVTTRDLKLVDCTLDGEPRIIISPFREPTSEEKEKGVWTRINAAFSNPVTEMDNVADYAPTQVLAEAFKMHGFDGIRYSSKVGSGKSIAIFDLAAADISNCCLYRVEEITHSFQKHLGHYDELGNIPDGVIKLE